MKIVFKFPPNTEKIKKVFPKAINQNNIVITYGDKIYNPYSATIDEALMTHESTHERQQKEFGGPEKWWDEFIRNPEFRLEQELEAYRAQYRYAVENYTRQQRRELLRQMAKYLSSELYGSIITEEKAREEIVKV